MLIALTLKAWAACFPNIARQLPLYKQKTAQKCFWFRNLYQITDRRKPILPSSGEVEVGCLAKADVAFTFTVAD